MSELLSHRQLQSLIEVSNVLNSSLDIDTIMDSIMQATVSVVDAADGGVLFLYDPIQDCLVAKSAQGFDSKIVEQVRLKPGESMTGLAFSARQCLIFENPEEVARTTSTLAPQNLNLMESSIPINPQSAICAPIISKGDCIGVITLDSFQPDLHFSLDDINLVKAISHQAAVAIEKARLYKEKQQTVRQLENSNYTITKQNEMLSRSVAIHGHLANLVLRGEGLSSILHYLNTMFGDQILLFNEWGDLIESSSRDPLSETDVSKIKGVAFASSDFQELAYKLQDCEINGLPHHMVSLPLGSKMNFLGFLVVLSVQSINEVDISALEHACTVISLELMKSQQIFETQQRLKGEFIEGLFTGKVDESLIQQAKLLDLDPNRNYLVTVIQIQPLHIDMKRHLIDLANRIFLESYPHSMVVTKHEQIILLLSFSNQRTGSYHTQQIMELAHQFQQEVLKRNEKPTVLIALGRAKNGLVHVGKSAQEAQRGLQLLRTYNLNKNVISYSELGVQRLLLQNSEDELMDFIQETLGPLLEYEAQRKRELLPTLLVYLEHNQNSKEAAESLHIHTNTLNYRLKRIQEILSIELTDAEQFMNLQLALRLHQYLGS
ncbi:helix-turn-helix domain-containing protein [Ammoniphilus sp. YIM 78166]|uniref:helix-turn-helix domain-containing protein n=1 Tax=Ammoniphilus sp. YIM 78166 TaxID=1644106 RepID=UPI0010702A26|nr:helix-turn-helix domain-containing protein [Ammoniphilus sp. YIM 78166]